MSKLSTGTILIVEDDADLRDLMRELLSELTPNLLMAANGAEALKVILSRTVHLIVSDIQMPVMNGIDLLRNVRMLGKDTPFVFSTAYGDKQNILEALRLGASDFIEKPFQNTAMLEIVEKVLELGIALLEADQELEALLDDARISTEEARFVRNMRKVALLMKLECEVYARRQSH